MEICDNNNINVEIELSEHDLEVFKNLIYNDAPPEVWTYEADTGDLVTIKFVKDE